MIYIFVVYRFSRDVDNVDRMVPRYLNDTLRMLSPLLATLVVVVYGMPLMTVVFVPLIIVFLLVQVKARTAQQQLQLSHCESSHSSEAAAVALQKFASAFSCIRTKMDTHWAVTCAIDNFPAVCVHGK